MTPLTAATRRRRRSSSGRLCRPAGVMGGMRPCMEFSYLTSRKKSSAASSLRLAVACSGESGELSAEMDSHRDQATKARALWFEARGVADLRQEPLREPAPQEAR